MPTHLQGFPQIVESRYIVSIYYLFPPFTALYGLAATFVAVLVDFVFHCRMYTCGG